MPKYTYTDRMAGPVIDTAHASILSNNPGRSFPVHAGEVRFACDAADILEADAKLLVATGLTASKSPSLCCAIS